MQITPVIIFALALFAYALTRAPDQHKPAWTHRLNSWQTLISLIAVIAAILIVMNPEFYALGIVGDSAFFDLLVLAISLQLQTILSRVWRHVVAGSSIIARFVRLRAYVTCAMLLFIFADIISLAQKITHRLSS